MFFSGHGFKIRMDKVVAWSDELGIIDLGLKNQIMICGSGIGGCSIGYIPDSLFNDNYSIINGATYKERYTKEGMMGMSEVLEISDDGFYKKDVIQDGTGQFGGFAPQIAPELGYVEVIDSATIRTWPAACFDLSKSQMQNDFCMSTLININVENEKVILTGWE